MSRHIPEETNYPIYYCLRLQVYVPEGDAFNVTFNVQNMVGNIGDSDDVGLLSLELDSKVVHEATPIRYDHSGGGRNDKRQTTHKQT